MDDTRTLTNEQSNSAVRLAPVLMSFAPHEAVKALDDYGLIVAVGATDGNVKRDDAALQASAVMLRIGRLEYLACAAVSCRSSIAAGV